MKHRNLTPDEIYQLEQQGCRADDWMNVLVNDRFKANQIWHSTFSGSILLGAIDSTNGQDSSSERGIFYSNLNNCEIADQVRIDHVNLLQNYSIGVGCVLEDIGTFVVEGETSFGNGEEIEVLNEAGGRSLSVYDKMSSQLAWLMVMCRHDNPAIVQLKKLIDEYSKGKKNSKGIVETNVHIKGCKSIRNICIGAYAQLSGVQMLNEGTILSSVESPTIIGDSVIANNFIVQEGSSIKEGAIIDKCLIGQAVKIGKQYSAENSVFFSNSECFHGEACSVFGGPYTVTHHKSSLLIAGQYSFFNAGSGTNQSNHMYKLGPMHQGIVERGSKTGSFSYMLWPSRLGPYSVVMGKHTSSFDAGDFPFSYITEEKGKTMLTPAMNLFTVGTKRDIQKWPARDRRKSDEKYDSIIFDLYAPYIIQKVLTAIDHLTSIYEKTPKEQEFVMVNGLNIHRLMLKTARKYYELALQVFLGEGLIVLVNKANDNNIIEELRKLGNAGIHHEVNDWLDVSGLFMPLSQLSQLLIEIKRGSMKSIDQVQDFFQLHFKQYPTFKSWYYINVLQERRGIDLSKITPDQVEQIILDWKKSLIKLNNMILKDAEKEFDATSKIGYGILHDESVIEADFEGVHGKIEENGFVIGLRKEIEMVEQKAEEIISGLK